MEFPHPLMVCDIGGTNTRIGLTETPGRDPVLLATVKTEEFSGLGECIEQVLSDTHAPRPRSLLACGAGPVADRCLKLTNAKWTIDGPLLAYHLGLSQGLLLNDFEAQALALPCHRPGWVHLIDSPQQAQGRGPCLVLGPGTGLGVAALISEEGRHLALASEAAHTDFGPVSPEDSELWPEIEKAHGRVTAEAVLSGPGLARLHRARMRLAGQGETSLGPAEIVLRALALPSGPESETVQHFWRLLGRFAGDMALTFLARGGVFLSGGIIPRIVPVLDAGAFRAAFENKAPMVQIVSHIQVGIITAPEAVLVGMAAIAARPEAYKINFCERAWR